MMRSTRVQLLRFLCISATPGAGCLGPAMQELGFSCYGESQVFKVKSEHVNPEKWGAVIRGGRSFHLNFIQDHDVAIGPPTSSAWESVYSKCPDYTKVILLAEPDKQAWAKGMTEEVMPRIQLLSQSSFKAGKETFQFFKEAVLPSEILHPREGAMGRPDPKKRDELLTVFLNGGGAGAVGMKRKELEELSENERNKGLLEAVMAENLADFEYNVIKTVPEKKLLVFNPEIDDWKKLCKFVGEPVPTELNFETGAEEPIPFPKHNYGEPTLKRFVEALENSEKDVKRVRKLVLLTVVLAGIGFIYFAVVPSEAAANIQKETRALQMELAEVFKPTPGVVKRERREKE